MLVLLALTLFGVASGCEHLKVTGFDYAGCNGIYSELAGELCDEMPTFKYGIRYLYRYNGLWKISNANCVWGYFHVVSTTTGLSSPLEAADLPPGQTITCSPIPQAEVKYEDIGCVQLDVKGYDYAGCNGVYDIIDGEECDLRPTFKMEASYGNRYLFRTGGRWLISNANCVGGSFHTVGRGHSPMEASQTVTCLKEAFEKPVVEVVARVPDIPIPVTVAGAEFYVKFQNTLGGQTKGWPNYGIAHGDIITVEGVKENALSFNGDNQYLDMGAHRDKCLGNLEKCPDGYSLTMIIKADDFSDGGTYYYFSSGGQSDKSHGMAVFTREGKLVVIASTSTKRWEIEAPDGAFPANDWTHLAVTWTEADGLSLYIDQDAPITDPDYESRTLLTTEFNNIYFGAPNNSPSENNGRASIDDTTSYNLVLTKAKITRMAGKVA